MAQADGENAVDLWREVVDQLEVMEARGALIDEVHRFPETARENLGAVEGAISD